MNRSLASAAAATLAFRSALRLAVGELLGGLAPCFDDARELALVLSSERATLPMSFRYRPMESFIVSCTTVRHGVHSGRVISDGNNRLEWE